MSKRVSVPVRNLLGIREDLATWGRIEVECLSTPERRGNSHYGEWQVYIRRLTGMGEVEKAIMVAGTAIEPKLYQTVGGLISLASKLGFGVPQIPLFEGEIGIWGYAQQTHKSDFKVSQDQHASEYESLAFLLEKSPHESEDIFIIED